MRALGPGLKIARPKHLRRFTPLRAAPSVEKLPPMKRDLDAEPRLTDLRYHTVGPDHLYIPIPFLFVTSRMRDEILAERRLILDLAQESTRMRQLELLARYDPALSADAFNSVLDLFEVDAKD